MADSTTHASAVLHKAKTEQLLSAQELLNVDVARSNFLDEAWLQRVVAVAVANDVEHQLNSDEKEAPPMRTDVRDQNKKRSFNRRRNRGNVPDLTRSAYVAMSEEAALQLAGFDPHDAQPPTKFRKVYDYTCDSGMPLMSLRIRPDDE
jgi:hypothetical protein